MADIIAVHVPYQLLSEAVQKAEFGRGRDWAYHTGFSIRTWPNGNNTVGATERACGHALL